MILWKNLLLVCAVSGTLAACGTTTTTSDTAQGGDKAGAAATGGVQTGKLDGGVAAPAGGLANVVYFDFDSDAIHAEDRGTITGHAKLLSQNRGKKVVLEGHCDERGTTEYNMALGERRAKAVKDAMTAAGATGEQIKTVSFGESRPANAGHDEDAWKLNRRVEVVAQ